MLACFIVGDLFLDGYSRVIAIDNLQPLLYSKAPSSGELKTLKGCHLHLPELSIYTQPYDLVKISGMNIKLNYFSSFILVRPENG